MQGFRRTLCSAALLLLVPAQAALAGFCGDDVDGVRVPCDCGDVIASDTTLKPADPIVGRRCPTDGLIIRMPPTAETVTVDLGGLAIVGSGRGAGLLVERGGTDGAVVIGGSGGRFAEIVGFGTGVHVPTTRGLRRMERIRVKGSLHEGFRLTQGGAILIDLQASDNGEAGLHIRGAGGRLIRAVTERNHGVGMRLAAPGIAVDGRSEGNRLHGVTASAPRIDLSRLTVRNNGGHGAVVRARGSMTEGLVTEGNALQAVRIMPVRPRR